MRLPFARIELSPEHYFPHMADDAAETVWVATPTIYLRRPSRSINDGLAKLSDCSITSFF